MNPREEAEAYRRIQREAIEEMRAAVSTMRKIKESLESNLLELTQIERRTRQRVRKPEKRSIKSRR